MKQYETINVQYGPTEAYNSTNEAMSLGTTYSRKVPSYG